MAGVSTRRLFNEAEFNVQDTIIIAGSFEVDGDDNDPVNVRGEGFTVTHSGDNDYLVTFAGKYPMLVSCVVSLEDADGGSNVIDAVASTEAYDSDAGTMVIRVAVESGGALTKDDTLNGERVNFFCVFHKYTLLSKTHA